MRFCRASLPNNTLQSKPRFGDCSPEGALGAAARAPRVRHACASNARPLFREAPLEPGGAGAVSPGQDGGAVLHTLVAGGCGDPAAAGCIGERGSATQGGRCEGMAEPQAERPRLCVFPDVSRPQSAADIETWCQPHR